MVRSNSTPILHRRHCRYGCAAFKLEGYTAQRALAEEDILHIGRQWRETGCTDAERRISV